ncbi:Sec-independent protein translocase subunit TatA [Rhizohabitans arisaemae]|uniref:Sec-independent protein translocase subunit TatA n=1 Tax=Rhizohabitans arisaemae TaxID=2720610 RepID=UPI0024B1FA5E|nr:Sec-independent protein translocase subunit TatA [Rhizohabitans arisaemae]
MPNLGVPELLIIGLILILLFGAKKLPEMARGLGRSMRIFKAETKGLADDDKHQAYPAQQAPYAAQPQQPVAPAIQATAAPVQPAPAVQQTPVAAPAPVVDTQRDAKPV